MQRSPELDCFLEGLVFLDQVFTGLSRQPAPGEELWAHGLAICPGGVANSAIALSRLGSRTAVASSFGDDAFGDYCWQTLEAEGVDLSASRRVAGATTPVTVSMAWQGDRGMVTHAEAGPLSVAARVPWLERPPPSRAVFAWMWTPEPERRRWSRSAVSAGTRVFLDTGWDESGQWCPTALDQLEGCHAFMPNAGEAMALTRTDSPEAALEALTARVPLAVVKDGPWGALAVDESTGEQARVPGIPVSALDPTGAGDVFGAALIHGTLAGWSLADRLAFANLCAALSVRQAGGSLSAPGWWEVCSWWAQARAAGRGDDEVRRRYAFLDDVMPPAEALSQARGADRTLPRA